MIKKQPYTAPEAETLVVRFEGMICLSYGEKGEAGTVDDEDPTRSYSF